MTAPSMDRRDRSLARYPELLVRHALVAYRESGAEQEQRVVLESHHISVLARATWEKCLWNYFPQIVTLERFYALVRLVQLRAGIANPVHPLDFQDVLIQECVSGKFRRNHLAYRAIVSQVTEHYCELEYVLRRQLKSKKHETREEAKRRLWDFCAEPDEESALRILFKPEQIQDLAERFEREPKIDTVPQLRFRTDESHRLSLEARVLVRELRFAFLSDASFKGIHCFKGHPIVEAAAAAEAAEMEPSNDGEPAAEDDHAEKAA